MAVGDFNDPAEYSVFSNNPRRPSDFRCELSKSGPWHAYVLLRAEAWVSHTLKNDEKKCGIRAVITKTETRGPYTRPFTVYFVHTKTAFKVKSVCKRFSDFKELDAQLKRKFSSFNIQFPPDKLFNSMTPEFVSDRRKQLQTYLDEAMAGPEIATCRELHEFLGIGEYNEDVKREQIEQERRERKKIHKPEDDKPETYLKMIEKAKLDGDRIAEAQGFNSLGLLYCESGLESEGLQCLETALDLCRSVDNKEGMVVALSNLGCLYNLLESSEHAIKYFQECYDLLEGDPIGQGEAQMKLSLTCAANGDNYEAIEHCLQCLKICRQLKDWNREASCLFTLGSIYYEAGEVRQAVEAFEQCLVLRRKTRDKIGLAEALNKLGLTYCDIGYDLRAMDYFEQSLVICEDNADLHGQAVCLQHLGNVFKMQKDNQLAVDFFERCLAVRQKVNDPRGIADCYDSLGLVYFDIGDVDAAIQNYERSLELRRDTADLLGECECYKCLGNCYMRAEDMGKAVISYERCLEIQRQFSESGLVDTLISLGLAHFHNSNHDVAIKCLEDALDMFQHLPPEDASAHSGKAVCLDHLGNVYSSIGKPEKAVTFYTMSLRVKKDIGDMTGEARCLVRIGLEFLVLEQLNRAFEAFTEALHMFERLEDDNGISICYENLGDTYMKMGEKRQAIFSYDRCLPIKVETWDKVGEAQCLDNLGLAHLAAGEWRLAAEYYEQSLAIWKAEGNKAAMMQCYENLGGVDFQLGEHMRSIECYVQHLTLSQEIGDGAADHEVLLRLGLSNAAIGEYQVALQFLQQAMSFYQELRDVSNRALCLQHIGSVQGKMGLHDDGMASLKQSFDLRTQIQDKLGIADCLQEMGLLFFNINDFANARARFEAAQRLLTETNDKSSISTCTMHIGACFAALGDVKEAKQHFQTALMADPSFNWAGKIDCLNHLGCVQTKLGEQQAIKTFSLALSNLRDKGNRVGEAGMLMQLGQAYAKLNDFPLALENLEQCLEVRKSLNDKRGQAEALMKLIFIHSMLRNFKRARDAYEECMALRSELNDQAGQAELLNLRALLAAQEGKIQEGIKLYHENLMKLKSEGNSTAIAKNLNNLGVCMSFWQDYNNAISHLQESLKQMKTLSEPESEAKTLINIGTCYTEQRNYDIAIECYEKAFVLCRTNIESANKATCYLNMGTVFLYKNEFEKAKEAFETAMRYLNEFSDKRMEARCRKNIGILHFRNHETKEAINYFSLALTGFRESGDKHAALECLQSLKVAYIRLGDAFQAVQTVHAMQEIFPVGEVHDMAGDLAAELHAARVKKDKIAEARALVQLADAQKELDVSMTLNNLKTAYEIFTGLNDREGQARCISMLAAIKLTQGEIEAALQSYKQAGSVLGDVWREGSMRRVELGADVTAGLGTCYMLQERYEEASQLLARALQLYGELEDDGGSFDVCNQLAMCYARLGDTMRCVEYLRRGIGGDLVGEKATPGKVASAVGIIASLFKVWRHEDALKIIALYEGNLATFKNQNDKMEEANCHWLLGNAYSVIDQLQQAYDSYSVCYQLRLLLGDEKGMQEALRKKGLTAFLCGNARAAERDLNQFLSMSLQTSSTTSRTSSDLCELMCTLSMAYLRLGSPSSSAGVLLNAIKEARGYDDMESEIRVIQTFGSLYKELWMSNRAIEHFQQACKMCSDIQDSRGEANCLLEMGKLHYRKGNTQAAIQCMEDALSIARRQTQDSSVANCLMAIGEVHYAQGDFVQTRAHFSQACQICKEHLDPLGEAKGLTGLSLATMKLGDSYGAIDQLLEALNIRKTLGDSKAEADCLRELAIAYAGIGKLGPARQSCEAAFQLAVQNADLQQRAQAEVLLGTILIKAGETEGAINQLEQAKEFLAKSIEFENSSVFLDPHELAHALSELAHGYELIGKWERSIDCLQQAEKISISVGDASALATYQANLGLVLGLHAQVQEASLKLKASLEGRKKHGNRLGVAECLLSEGIIEYKQGNAKEGMTKLNQALTHFKELQDKRAMANVYLHLGIASGSSQQGIVHLESALLIQREVNDLIGEADVLKSMAILHARLNNSDASCKAWQDCLNLQREIGNLGAVKLCLLSLCFELDGAAKLQDLQAYSGELEEVARKSNDLDALAASQFFKARCVRGETGVDKHSKAIAMTQAALDLCRKNPNSKQAIEIAAECFKFMSENFTSMGREADALQAKQEEASYRERLRKH